MELVLYGLLVVLLIALLGAFIALYVVIAKFLNNLNKLIYGKSTVLAWIPILDIYLLGKLAVNKFVGWALVVSAFLSSTYSTTKDGMEFTVSILPEGARSIISTIYGFALLGSFIYAIIKYNKLNKDNLANSSEQSMHTPTQRENYAFEETQPLQGSGPDIYAPMPNQQQPSQLPTEGSDADYVNQNQPIQNQEQNPNVENINN